MSSNRLYYAKFAVAIFLGNLIVGVIDESTITLGIVVKALIAGIIAAAFLAWFERRKRRDDVQ